LVVVTSFVTLLGLLVGPKFQREFVESTVDVNGFVDKGVEQIEACAATHQLYLNIGFKALSEHSCKSFVVPFCDKRILLESIGVVSNRTGLLEVLNVLGSYSNLAVTTKHNTDLSLEQIVIVQLFVDFLRGLAGHILDKEGLDPL
jgi:hypothetical protein